MRRVYSAVLGLTLLFTLLLGAVGAMLCAPANEPIGPPPADLAVETLSLPSVGGDLKGWLVRAPHATGVVLLLHGVRANRRSMLGRARFLHRLGYTVLMIDLPAHGESAGRRITFGHDEGQGVVVALDYLRHEFPDLRVGVIGVSLGAASLVLADLARPPDAVVLESMYPTIEEATSNRLAVRFGRWSRMFTPLLIWQLPFQAGVSAEQLRPIDRIARLGAPILIAAGAEDRHTMLVESHRLFAAALEPKQEWIVPGAMHVDLHAFNPHAYESRVGAFFGLWLGNGDRAKRPLNSATAS